MSVRTVKISNVSLSATEQDLKEFFSFSGDIEYVELQRGDEWSQVAYVTFRDAQGADTAMLLSGATIVDLSVLITPAPEYQLPPDAKLYSGPKDGNTSSAETAVQKAENVVSTMLAKGFVLGKDALNKAKAFDEKHQLTSTASAKVSDLDKKIGLSEKISMGASVVNEKVLEMDNKFHVSEKARSAIAAAEEKVGNASSALMKNRYIFTSAAWVTGAINKVAKAASDVGSKALEKAAADQEHKKPLEDDLANFHLSETSRAPSAEHSHLSETSRAPSTEPSTKSEPVHGLIL